MRNDSTVCTLRLAAILPIWSEDPAEQVYYSRYVTAGLEAIMQFWVERSFEDDIEKVVGMAKRIMGSTAQPCACETSTRRKR